jgi:hypothetical protein
MQPYVKRKSINKKENFRNEMVSDISRKKDLSFFTTSLNNYFKNKLGCKNNVGNLAALKSVG